MRTVNKGVENHLTREQLEKELAAMRRDLENLEACKGRLDLIQKRYERLLDSAPDAMLFVDVSGKIQFVNAQFEKLFGYTEEELAGRDILVLIPERYREKHRNNVAAYFDLPRARPMGTDLQIYARKKDGTEFPADISLSPLEADGDLLAIAAIRDISDHKKAESQIRRNYLIQAAISEILKIALEPISLDDKLDRVLGLIFTIPGIARESRGYIYLYEDESDVLVLKMRRELGGSLHAPCERIASGKCICGKAAASCSFSYVDCMDERHEIRYSKDFGHGHYCAPIVAGQRRLGLINILLEEGHERSADEEQFLAAVANTLATVIEWHRAETERDMFRRQLAEAEKIAALGRMTASVAHDIRNPLTAIGGFARRLEKKISGVVKEKEYVEFIISEVNRLENILRNILSFSRGDALNLERSDVNHIAERALKIFDEVCAERNIEVKKDFQEVPAIDVDRERLLEAVENIISNAIDAMPEGGTLVVGTERSSVKGEQCVAVHVSDTGEGIKQENLDRIFEPLFSTKVASKGVGLGLPITKKILEDHGASIRVESREGRGSRFSIFLPISGKKDRA